MNNSAIKAKQLKPSIRWWQHIERQTVKILTILLTSIFLHSCNEQISTVKDPTIDLKEGKLIYAISGEGTTSSWELEILFDQDNAIIYEKYARGAGIKYIYDKKSNEILGLFDNTAFFGIKKNSYFIYYTPEELVRQALSSNYGDTLVTKTNDFKDILGYKCQKFIIKHGDQVTVDVWLTDKIKPGIIYPWTPLTFENIALEYEIKILGTSDRRYRIKSISDEKIDKKEFEHIVPDPYYLIIPASVFSIDTIYFNLFEENTFESFSYPYFKEERQETIDFLKEKIESVVKSNEKKRLIIEFFVNIDGSISDIDIAINYSKKDPRNENLKSIIKSMKTWTPAKVRGKPVKSKVTIFA